MLFAVVAAVVVPSLASAQYAPYTKVVESAPYQPLPIAGGGAVKVLAPTSTDDGSADAELPSGFSVRFFDTVWTEASMGTNGYLTFGPRSSATSSSSDHYANSLSNQALPSTTKPQQLIAAWWDDMVCPSGGMSTQVLGTAPTRQYVLQWHCYRYSNSSYWFQVQLWLQEGGSTIKLHYGAIASSYYSSSTASTGIESPGGTVGYDAFGCRSSCKQADWVEDRVIKFVQGPDVSVASAYAPAVLYAGIVNRFEAEVANTGGELASSVGVRFRLSADELLSEDDVEIGTSPDLVDLAVAQVELLTLDAPVPWVEPGEYWIIAEGDPANLVVEDIEENNWRAHGPISVGRPAPDLVVESVVAPATMDKAAAATVELTVRNIGNLHAQQIPFQLYASVNDVPSATDLVIASGTVDVERLTATTLSVPVALPAELASGEYFVTAIIDANDDIFELDEFNNAASSATPALVLENGLAILTHELPAASLGLDYCTALEAAGGDGTFAWSVVDGSALPPGLRLDVEMAGTQVLATLLCGAPEQLGLHAFELEVASAGQSERRTFELQVVRPDSPIVIQSLRLPDALFQQPYDGRLVAVGGQPPYEWTLVDGALPAGMRLSADGAVRGSPSTDGDFAFVVRVRDAQDRSAEAQIELKVTPPGRLRCMTTELPDMLLGEEVTAQLAAAGGSRPYSFTTLETRRLSTSAIPGDTFAGEPPPGFTLSATGEVTGTAEVAGRYVWLVQAVDESGRNPDTCTIAFETRTDHGLSVATTSLPDVYVGAPYKAKLVATGSDSVVTWSMANGSTLPEGLELEEDGTLKGSVTADLLQGKDVETFPFLVKAIDSRNRSGVASLSVTVYFEPPRGPKPTALEPPDDGGCQTGGGAPALLGLLGVALGLARRRRR